MQSSVIPSFFLYGEPPRTISERFLHLEDLDVRSRPSEWNIRPHAHANLNHLFHIASGAGTMRAESQALVFVAPCLLVVPAKVVHGFRFDPDTRGSVLTIAESYLDDLFRREPDLAPLLERPARVAVEDSERFADDLRRLSRELAWKAPGHGAAIEGHLLNVLVDALRCVHHAAVDSSPARGPQAVLVAGFRTLIEERYRQGLSIESYAETLRVSMARLRNACLKTSRISPNQMVQDRIMLEAKRLLLYSNMTVAEAGFYLGFQDPAYFSRFFSKAGGESPRAFRHRHEGRPARAPRAADRPVPGLAR